MAGHKQPGDAIIAKLLGFAAVEIIKIDPLLQTAHLQLLLTLSFVLVLDFCYDFFVLGCFRGNNTDPRLYIRFLLWYHTISP